MTVRNEGKAWSLSGSHPEIYEMQTDSSVFHTGSKSGYFASKAPAGEEQFGTMMQSFSAETGVENVLRCPVLSKQRMP